MLGFDQFLFDFCFSKLLFILKNKENNKNRENMFDSILFKNTENNKSFQKQKPNRHLVFFENCYCSLNLLFFVLPIIFITIKRKGNHMFFKQKIKRNKKCSPCFSEQKTNFKTISN